jgi:hypothetical protein
MHVIRHDFDHLDLHFTQRRRLTNQFSEALIDAICQHRTTVLQIPNHVIGEAGNSAAFLA